MGALLLAGAFVVSPGLFNIDEFVLFAGAKAFLSSGALTVENGWGQFASPDLKLWILVAGPHGLAPQYPPGLSVVGAPLLAVFGPRGLMLPNVVAAIGTLVVLWRLAERHFGGRGVALTSVLMLAGASFWLDYVYAVWPHVIGVFCVTLALLWVLDALEGDERLGLKAFGAGAAVGLGLLFRTDTVLAIPALGLIAILFARRPFRIGAFFGAGLAPFVALASAANQAKFGTFNPLSYGQTGSGGTTLSAHLVPIAALAAVSLLIVAVRFSKWRPGRRTWLIGLVVVALAAGLTPAVRAFVGHYLAGAWALLVDATTIHDPRPSVRPMPGGLLSFWGLWKKALGQSMPWLGLLLLAVHARKDAALRRAVWVVLILAGVWSLPFFITAWHGGMSGNMRYLLPLVPALCALSARLLIDLAAPLAQARRVLLAGALAGVGAIGLWMTLHPTGAGGAQQILSTWMLGMIAVLSLLAGLRWTGQPAVRAACLGAIGAGLVASTFYLVADVGQTQAARAANQAIAAGMDRLPERAVAYVPGPYIVDWAFEPGHLGAMPGHDGRIDAALVDQALADGYRVLVWPGQADATLRARYGARLGRSGVSFPGGELLEVRAEPADGPATRPLSPPRSSPRPDPNGRRGPGTPPAP